VAEARHFCPDCGNIDLVITKAVLAGQTSSASCPSCAWSGPLNKTIGAVTTEQFWDADRIGDVLLRVMATRAAGPLVQALEFIGLLPRKRERPERLPTNYTQEEMEAWEKARNLFEEPSTPEWNRLAQASRDAVMQRIMEAAITAAFEETERQNRLFAIATNTDIHPVLKAGDEEFGGDQGNVTNIKKARKKRRKR
jgi:hypothetical protein